MQLSQAKAEATAHTPSFFMVCHSRHLLSTCEEADDDDDDDGGRGGGDDDDDGPAAEVFHHRTAALGCTLRATQLNGFLCFACENMPQVQPPANYQLMATCAFTRTRRALEEGLT